MCLKLKTVQKQLIGNLLKKNGNVSSEGSKYIYILTKVSWTIWFQLCFLHQEVNQALFCYTTTKFLHHHLIILRWVAIPPLMLRFHRVFSKGKT